jgi:hypothetical protein
MAIVLMTAARSFPAEIAGLGYWALGCLSFMLGRLLFALPIEMLPDWLRLLVANGLLFGCMGLWLLGTRTFYGRRIHWHWFHLIWAGGRAR